MRTIHERGGLVVVVDRIKGRAMFERALNWLVSSWRSFDRRVFSERAGIRATVIGTAIAAAALVLSVVIWQLAPSDGDGTTPTPPNRTPGSRFVDNFQESRLDEKKWKLPPRPDLIYAQDGLLNFRVTSDDTRNPVTVPLLPKSSVRPFTSVSFTISVPSFEKVGKGGPSLLVTQSSGRNHEIVFGVGSSVGSPEVAALFCTDQICSGQYDDFKTPVIRQFATGESVPVKLASNGRRLEFQVNNEVVAEGPDDGSLLVDFKFKLYGTDGESWHVTADDLVVQ